MQLTEAFRDCLKKYSWLYFMYIPANCTGEWQQVSSGHLQLICCALRLLSPGLSPAATASHPASTHAGALQPMDVGLQKPIKDAIRAAWTDFTIDNVQQQKAAGGTAKVNLRMSALKPVIPSLILAAV